MRFGKAGVDNKLKILCRDGGIQIKSLLIIRVLKSERTGVIPAVPIHAYINMHFLEWHGPVGYLVATDRSTGAAWSFCAGGQ